jgi:hypothetical protein
MHAFAVVRGTVESVENMAGGSWGTGAHGVERMTRLQSGDARVT